MPTNGASVEELRQKFIKEQLTPLIEDGINKIQKEHLSYDDLNSCIIFPEFNINTNKAEVKSGLCLGRAMVTMPIEAGRYSVQRLFSGLGIGFMVDKTQLHFHVADTSEEELLAEAKKGLTFLDNVSKAITNEIELFKENFVESVKKVIAKKEQHISDRKAKNDRLTKLLHEKN